MAMKTCNRCGHTVCNCELLGDLCPKCKGPCECKATSVYYAPASHLHSVLKDVQAGKLYGVIPMAIDKTAVIKVMPTEQSKTQIQPSLKDLKIFKSLNETLDELNSPKKTKNKGTADKTQHAIRDFIRTL